MILLYDPVSVMSWILMINMSDKKVIKIMFQHIKLAFTLALHLSTLTTLNSYQYTLLTEFWDCIPKIFILVALLNH